MDRDFDHIGKPVYRQDALAKVTGRAKFADDYSFPGMLHAVMVRTSSSHAVIKKVDYSDLTQNHPDIVVCDYNDIKGDKKIGPIKKDQPIFCYEKIVTPGDVVCMLIGETEKELLSLRELVKVELELLPVLTDPKLAIEDESPLIHPEQGTNLIVHYPLRKGDVDQGFVDSEHIIEQTYSTPHIEHAYIEPEAVIALPAEDGIGVKIIGSIQNPHTTRKVVASVLNLPLIHVRVIQAELGGSFGGKDDTMNIISARAAVAAVKTGRPVKIKYGREDSINESYKRHPYIMHYKAGFNSDGKIIAMKIDIIADGGAYASMSPFVTWRTVVQATGPYEIENVHTDVRAVYTNNPYTGAMRGFGSPQPIFAQESLVDEIAEKVDKSPFEIRRLNGYKEGSFSASGHRLEQHDVNLQSVLELAVEETDFNEKWQRSEQTRKREFNIENRLVLNPDDFIEPEQHLRRGIGLSCSFRGCSLGAEGIDAAAAYISVQQDGSVYLLSGLAENGQGLKTTFSIIAAEVFGISPEHVKYLDPDTGYIPDSGPTVASRSTLMGGSAVKNAAENIKNKLETILLSHWNINDNHKLLFSKNEVISSPANDKRISFKDLCELAYTQGECLASLGWFKGPDVNWHEETGQGAAYFTYVYGCQVAEVIVDINTGEVHIEKITAVHDPGKVINLLGAQGQVYGGVTQGAGYALWEEINSYDGRIKEDNFDQYLIPTSMEIEEIKAIFLEGKEIYGPWGGKSLGEPTLELTAAAISNAVKNAVGVRYFNLPLNLEEILLGRKLKPTDIKRGSTS